MINALYRTRVATRIGLRLGSDDRWNGNLDPFLPRLAAAGRLSSAHLHLIAKTILSRDLSTGSADRATI